MKFFGGKTMMTYATTLAVAICGFDLGSALGALKCLPARVDLGEVECGQTAKTTVYLHNTGDIELKLKNIRSTCGCTVAAAKADRLGPGERAPLQIDVRTDSGKIGAAKNSVFVEVDSPIQPVVEIPIFYTVVQSLQAFPQNLAIGTLTRGANCQKEFLLLPRDKEYCRIKSIEAGEGIYIDGIARIGVDELAQRYPELGLDKDLPRALPRAYLVSITVDADKTGPRNDKIEVT